MNRIKEGDRVQICTREQTPDDVKARSFFPYMCGLTGRIHRVYEDQTAAMVIDRDKLPQVVQERHTEAEVRMKDRWIASLSDEARSRLTPAEKEFHLNYVLLVRLDDLNPIKTA